MSFRISGLPAEHFAHLFALSDEELSAQGAVRRLADGRTPGYPCRISLTDAQPGDELLLVNYEHHPVGSPYRMRFAVYVRKGEATYATVDEVPEQLRIRTLAVRAFDGDAMMVGWELVDGRQLEAAIERLFADPRAAYMSTTLRPDATPRGWTAPEGRGQSRTVAARSFVTGLVPVIYAFCSADFRRPLAWMAGPGQTKSGHGRGFVAHEG